MWRTVLTAVLAFCIGFRCMAQQEIEPLLMFLGIDSPEEIDSYEAERLADFLDRPIRINIVGASALTASGLFTMYQAASLNDYRTRHGDVLSLAELAAVDGFGEQFVRVLAPFVSLESRAMPGQRAGGADGVRNDLAVRSAVKMTAEEGQLWNYGMRYRIEYGSIEAGIAVASSYDASGGLPDAYSGYVAWNLRRANVRIVVGDFNSRFGQGLALWNGMSMSGVSAPSSLAKRPSGISQSRSFTGTYSMTGLAAEWSAGQLSASLMLAAPGVKGLLPGSSADDVTLLPAANISWSSRNGRIGMTHYAEFSGLFPSCAPRVRIPDMKTSLDGSWCVRGVDIFAEAAFDWLTMSVAALAGTSFPAGENLRLATMLRYYPPEYSALRSGAVRSTTKCSNEYAASFCGEFSAGQWVKLRGQEGFGASRRRHTGNFAVDVAFFPEPKDKEHLHSMQVKALAVWNVTLSDAWSIRFRFSERIRSWGEPFRTDMRADLIWQSGRFSAAARLNALKCVGWGLLGYAEGGFRDGSSSVYLRGGLFRIDDWDDRIYAYERDAPGNFSVPAFYGRGMWASISSGWRFAMWGKLYARASYMTYPFMPAEKKKPGKAELKLQFVFSF